MNIQIFGARSIPAAWGGFDNTASELAARFAEKGNNVRVYVMRKYCSHGLKCYKNIQLIYIPTLYGKFLETFIHEIISCIVGLFNHSEINYILGCRTSFIYSLYRLFGKKIIINTDGLDFERDKWGRFAKLYLKINYWIAAKIGNHLIHDNTHIQNYFYQHFQKKGVFISIGGYEYKSTNCKIISQYNLEPKSYYLIACRIEPENNVHVLIEGFIKSKSVRKLVIAGGANYQSHYIDHLKKIANDNVIFLGPVYTENHIEELHYYSYAYLHGHRVGGTNPSLLKAMGCGNLIIANETNYNLEVLGENGVYFKEDINDIADKINFIENRIEDRKILGIGARNRLKKYYTWNYSAQLHLIFFEYIIGFRDNYKETF